MCCLSLENPALLSSLVAYLRHKYVRFLKMELVANAKRVLAPITSTGLGASIYPKPYPFGLTLSVWVPAWGLRKWYFALSKSGNGGGSFQDQAKKGLRVVRSSVQASLKSATC